MCLVEMIISARWCHQVPSDWMLVAQDGNFVATDSRHAAAHSFGSSQSRIRAIRPPSLSLKALLFLVSGYPFTMSRATISPPHLHSLYNLQYRHRPRLVTTPFPSWELSGFDRTAT